MNYTLETGPHTPRPTSLASRAARLPPADAARSV